MDPTRPGWLKEYFELRKWQTASYSHEQLVGLRAKMEDSFYEYIQPTGLMYGQPVAIPSVEGASSTLDTKGWSQQDKLKVTLVEAFLQASLVFQRGSLSDFDLLSETVATEMRQFYAVCYPGLVKNHIFSRRKKDVYAQAEQILEKRINPASGGAKNLLGSFFHNSLLFLDIYFYKLWVDPSSNNNLEHIYKRSVDLRFSLMKVIVASAHADRIIQVEEKQLFETFLQSCLLPREERRVAKYFFEDGLELNELYLPELHWVLSKFVLELALLTTWADRRMLDEEMRFLKDLGKRLYISEEDFQASLVSIEAFVVNNWDELMFLQDSYDLEEFSEKLLRHLGDIVEVNKGYIARGISQHEELTQLLIKNHKQTISDEEKEVLLKELLAVLRGIPAFFLIAMPGSFINLPILLKVLPQDALLPADLLDS